jgi:hypothetical protein
MPIYTDIDGNMFMEASLGTRFHCVKRSCTWNNSGACEFKGLLKIGIECNKYTIEKPTTELPKDSEDPSCSSGRRCWVTASFFARTMEEVIEKKKMYYKKYPTQGYSTYDAGPSFRLKTGIWQGIIRRYSTCD